MENTLNKVRNKIEAIRELFGDKEVTLSVTFRICDGNITADIKQITIADKVVKEPESKVVENDDAAQEPTDTWSSKLPPKFISLAVRYNGLNRFTYHTLHNNGGIIKAQWKDTLTGGIEEISPYITVRDYAQGSMNYLMNLCNPNDVDDRWRDFDVLKIAPGNWNSVVKNTLITDPKAEESAMTVVVYDIYMKSLQLIHFDEDEVAVIIEACDDVRKDRHFQKA